MPTTQNPFTTRRVLALTMGVGLAAVANVVAVIAAFWLDGKDILTTVIGFDIAASQTVVAYYFIKRETEDGGPPPDTA